jgi:hypothetical protein
MSVFICMYFGTASSTTASALPRRFRLFNSSSAHVVLAATILNVGCLLATAIAQPAYTQDFSRPAKSPGTNLDSSDYGAGGHMNATIDQATGVLIGQVFDPQNNLRREVKETYSTEGGSKHEAERQVYNFGPKGDLLSMSDYKFDLKGGLSYLDNEHFGQHGERTWEQKIIYRPDGFDTSTWHVGLDYQHSWTKETTSYKPLSTTPGKHTAQLLQSPLPSSMQIGVLFPRDFHAGETVTGSLWPATYAEGFKLVPGLSEYTFPIEVAQLPDGTPSWSSLEIGIKNDGYWPVNPNGTFSVHIPSTWTGPLQLQTRDLYSLPGVGPSGALLDIGNPVAAPVLPRNLLSPKVTEIAKYEDLAYLKHLWNLAYDVEIDINHAYKNKDDSSNWDEIDDLEYYEGCLWDEIDSLIDSLPPSEVAQLASEQIARANKRIKTLDDGPQTPENQAELKDMQGWTDFLDDEVGHAHWLAGDRFWITETPYWTNPILTQGKLGAIRGNFYNDPLDTNLHIGANTIWPLAGTGSELYFMPPIGLTPGLNNLILDGPGMPPTEMPVFYMTLTMWADQLSLHKGQSTTYHVKLDGLQGLPASAWSSSFFPSDLVSPSELSSGSPSNSQSGSITLSVTNMSPATIAMQNSFTTLDAKLFQPSGSYQLDGGVTAIADGGFNISGVARAYLQPELGLGYPQGSTPPATIGFNDSIWNPSFHLSYNPASATAKYTFPDCFAAGTDQTCTPRPDYSAVFNAGDNAIAPVDSATPSAAERDAAITRNRNTYAEYQKASNKLDAKEKLYNQVWSDVDKIPQAKLLHAAYNRAREAQTEASMRNYRAISDQGKQPSASHVQKIVDTSAALSQAESDAKAAFDAITKALGIDLSMRLQFQHDEYMMAHQAMVRALVESTATKEVLLTMPPPASPTPDQPPFVPKPSQPNTPLPNIHPPQ